MIWVVPLFSLPTIDKMIVHHLPLAYPSALPYKKKLIFTFVKISLKFSMNAQTKIV